MVQFKHKSMIEGKFGFKCLFMLLESWILHDVVHSWCVVPYSLLLKSVNIT